MSLTTTSARYPYSGNGSATVFAFPEQFHAKGDLVVVVTTAGADVTKTIVTDYNVFGDLDPSGGTVVFNLAPASGTTITIYRSPAATQSVDYVPGDDFPAETHERALDRLTMLVQRCLLQLQRCLQVPVSASAVAIPDSVTRAGKTWQFDVNGNLTLVNLSSEIAAAAASAAASAASAAQSENFAQESQEWAELSQAGTGNWVQKSASFVAVANGRYIITAASTVTDPTPVQALTFVCFLRSGTMVIGGTQYTVIGTEVTRSYHSGAWSSKEVRPDATATGDGDIIQGREYLYAWYERVRARTASKIVMSGDSTTAGDATTTPYRIWEIIPNLALEMGFNGITAVNRGQSGATPAGWLSTYLAGDLAEVPDLMTIRWGMNPNSAADDAARAALTVTNIRTGLATIRASRTVAQTAIVLMMVNSATDDAGNRTTAYMQAVRLGLQKAARDYQCAFFDTYQLLRVSSFGGWINPDAPGVYVHPLNIGNMIIGGALADLLFPRSLFLSAQSAFVENTVHPTGSKIGSDLPSAYRNGLSILPALTTGSGTVFAYQGYVITMKHASGYTMQINVFADSTPSGADGAIGAIAIRHGLSGTGWSNWFYPGASTVSSAALLAALGDATGTGAAVFALHPTFTGKITRSGGFSQAAWGGNGAYLNMMANTITDTSTAAGGTATYAGFNTFHPPPLAATNAGVTTTIASTVYIGGAPTAGANMTITTAYALHVDAGLSRFDENVSVGGVVISSTQNLSGPGAANVTTATTKITTTGAADAITLADGVDGQTKTILHDVDGGSFVLTPTTKTGWSTYTSTAAGESITLRYVTTRGWIVIGSYGGVIAP